MKKMKKKEQRRWIITSLFDSDFYKWTMMYFAWRYFPSVQVEYHFKNRTISLPLAKYIDVKELKRQIEHVSTLNLFTKELNYLHNLRIDDFYVFGRNKKDNQGKYFIDYLKNFQLDKNDVRVKVVGDQIEIVTRGIWHKTELWETIILSIVSELLAEGYMIKHSIDPGKVREEGLKRYAQKYDFLKDRPYIKNIVEFGTRRRFSAGHQDNIVEDMKWLNFHNKGQFIGTSNVRLAMKYNLAPIGSMAHSLFMVLAGVFHDEDDKCFISHDKVYELWEELFEGNLLIALTDTYSSDWAFEHMPKRMVEKWKGFRHDSGDPFEYTDKVITLCQKHGVDYSSKMVLFSDGLEPELMDKLAIYCVKKGINYGFGWGTNLTNDMGLMKLPSIVNKAVRSCGYDTAKLSDDAGKHTGTKQAVERVIKLTNYQVTRKTEQKY